MAGLQVDFDSICIRPFGETDTPSPANRTNSARLARAFEKPLSTLTPKKTPGTGSAGATALLPSPILPSPTIRGSSAAFNFFRLVSQGAKHL